MENGDVEKGYVYMNYNDIAPETPIGPLIIFTLHEDLSYEIYTVMPLKGDYFSFQPILSINKLPPYMFENVTYITLNDSSEINSRSKGELIKIGNNISLIDNIDPIYTNTYITTNGIVKNVFTMYGRFEFSFRDLGVFNDIVFNIKDNNTNLKIIEKFKLVDTIGCILLDDYDIILINATYYNGTITGIKEGLYVQYNVNQTTGEITLKHEIDIVELYNKVNSL